MAHGNCALDGPVAVHHRPAQRDRLRAYGEAANRGAEVDAGPDPAVAAADRGGDRMPERAIVFEENGFRSVDQGVVGRRERQRAGQGRRVHARRDVIEHQSAASASSSLGGEIMVLATTPELSRTSFSMLAAMSG